MLISGRAHEFETTNYQNTTYHDQSRKILKAQSELNELAEVLALAWLFALCFGIKLIKYYRERCIKADEVKPKADEGKRKEPNPGPQSYDAVGSRVRRLLQNNQRPQRRILTN